MSRVIVAMFLILIAGQLGLGYMHEKVHAEIYRHYEIESHTEYFSYFPHIATVAEEPCPSDSCILAHNMNEVVGYPIQVIYMVWGFLFICSYIAKEEKNE